MGCDIHVFVERKIDDGDWEIHPGHINRVDDGIVSEIREVDTVSRDYNLFAKLANVRGYSGRVPLGIPDDISDAIELKLDDWGVDGHSHSFMSIEEFEQILKKAGYEETDATDMFPSRRGFMAGVGTPPFSTIVAACKRDAEELKVDNILLTEEEINVQHRVIFFFDN